MLAGGAIAGAVAWTELLWPRLVARRAGTLAFEPLKGLPGYRVLRLGAATSGPVPNPWIGLQARHQSGSTSPRRVRIPDNPCLALYGQPLPDRVQMALFTDFNCAYCRMLDPELQKFTENTRDRTSLKIHHLPLLGESSLWAARGALAAARQGSHDAFHKRLMRAAFSIGPAYLKAVAEDLELDKDRLMTDATGPEVNRTIAESRGLAARLGIFGTPALLVGRTLVMGRIGMGQLHDLVALEAAETSMPNCAVLA